MYPTESARVPLPSAEGSEELVICRRVTRGVEEEDIALLINATRVAFFQSCFPVRGFGCSGEVTVERGSSVVGLAVSVTNGIFSFSPSDIGDAFPVIVVVSDDRLNAVPSE